MNEIRWYVTFWAWLPWVTIIHLKVSHLCCMHLWAVPFYCWIVFHLWTYHDFFSLFSVKGHLRCFQFWIMMNKAMVNTHIHVFVGTHVASMDCVINTYAQVPHCLSAWLYHFASPPVCGRVPHSHQRSAIVRIEKILAILISVLWYHVVVLIYISLIINNVEHLFLCVYLPL